MVKKLALVVLLSGCMTMEMIHVPENRTQVTVKEDYRTVYRLALQYAQYCDNPASSGTIYPDNDTANITSVDHSVTRMTMDLFKVPEGTLIDVYAYSDRHRASLAKGLQEVIRSGKTNTCV